MCKERGENMNESLRNTMIILLMGALISMLFGFGVGNLYNKEVNSTNAEVKEIVRYVNTTTIIMVTPTPTPTPTPYHYVKEDVHINTNNKWGGIPASVDNPPKGTYRNAVETHAYGKTVVTSEDYSLWYIYVGHWGWFTKDEYNNLPEYNKLYDVSPYSERETPAS